MTLIIIMLVTIIAFLTGVVYASLGKDSTAGIILEGAAVAVVAGALAGVLSLVLNQ